MELIDELCSYKTMKGVRSRKISGAASPVVQLFATSWGVPYCLRRILRQSQAVVCIAGEPRHAHLTEQEKMKEGAMAGVGLGGAATVVAV